MKKNIYLTLLLFLIIILLTFFITGCDLFQLVSENSNGDGSSNGSGSSNEDSTWTTRLLGVPGENTGALDITLVTNDYIYTTGYTYDNLDGEIKTGIRDLFVVKYNANGVKQWTRLLGVAGEETVAHGITSDSNGNVYATGWTQGNLDGQILTGNQDLFIVKYDANGVKQWTRLLGTSGYGYTYARGITSDLNGNVYATGETGGDLDGQTRTGTNDLFIVKYNANGVKQWTRLLGVSGTATYADCITSDLNGNVYTTGYTFGDLDQHPKAGTADLFVVKYDASGVKQWTRLLGVPGGDTRAYGIISDLNGNIYVTGVTTDNLDGQTFLSGAHGLFVVKYNVNGVIQWTRLLGVAGGNTHPYDIISDSNGNIYTAGYTSGNLDGQTLTGTLDLFVVKYNANSVKQWTRLLGVAGVYTIAYGIISDSNGNVYTTGLTEGNLDGQIKTGKDDLFIVKYNTNGVKQ